MKVIRVEINGKIENLDATVVEDSRSYRSPKYTETLKCGNEYIVCVYSRTDVRDCVALASFRRLKDIVPNGKETFDIYGDDERVMRAMVERQEYEDSWGRKLTKYDECPECYKREPGFETTHGTVVFRSDNYRYYVIRADNGDLRVIQWMRCIPKESDMNPDVEMNDLDATYSTCMIMDVVRRVVTCGMSAHVDAIPEFQRGLVWDDEMKEKLIDSIMNNISIGSIVVADISDAFRDNGMFVVIDGQHRIDAVISFIRGETTYKGRHYYELNSHDRHKFQNRHINVGTLNIGRGDHDAVGKIVDTFLKINTGGVKVDDDVISNARRMLSDSLKESM